jgi:hypothetical protein
VDDYNKKAKGNSLFALDDEEDLFQAGLQPSISASDSLSDWSIESPSPQEPSLDLRSLDGGKNIAKLSQTPGIQLKFKYDEGKCYLSTLDSDAVQVDDANKKAKGAKQRPQRGSSRKGNSARSPKIGDATARTARSNEGITNITRKLLPPRERIAPCRSRSSEEFIERPNRPKLDSRAESLRAIFNSKPPRRMNSQLSKSSCSNGMKPGTHRKRAQTTSFANDLNTSNHSGSSRSSSSRTPPPPPGAVPPRRFRPPMQRAQSCRPFSSPASKSRGANNFVTDFHLVVETTDDQLEESSSKPASSRFGRRSLSTRRLMMSESDDTVSLLKDT